MKGLFSKEVLNCFNDGDEHTKTMAKPWATSAMEVITVGYMIENPIVEEEDASKK